MSDEKTLSDRLADRLLEYPKADEPEFTPKTEFDGSSGYIQTGALKEAPKDYSDILRQFGYDPEKVCIVGNPRVSRWQQRSRKLEKSEDGERLVKTSEFETVWLEAYRFSIAPVVSDGALPDVASLIKQARVVRRQATGPHWFVFQAGDQQIGKVSRDGSTPEIVDRYVRSVEDAKAEFASLKRHGVEGIQISIPGDCLEGNQSQGGRNQGYMTQETITDQLVIFQRLLMYTIEQFAPLAEQVKVTIVGGNHDQAQRDLNTVPGNNWATTAATLINDRLADNPLAMGHVQMLVPDKWSASMTVPIGDTVVTVVHGNQWRRNGAMKWWSEQALGMQPAGGAQLLQHGHWHTYEVETTEHRTRVSSPTFDCGSDYFRDAHGATSRRGAVVYLLKSGEVSRMSLV